MEIKINKYSNLIYGIIIMIVMMRCISSENKVLETPNLVKEAPKEYLSKIAIEDTIENRRRELVTLQNNIVIDTTECLYISEFKELGNIEVDTIRVGRRLVDPIDDKFSFKKVKFDFVTKGGKVFKKAKTHRHCDGKLINVEYYQDFSRRINLSSYKEYDDKFFTTNDKVFFWWINSDGHLMIPINNADPKTFKPFENICGGVDNKGVFYGCPNFGVFKLEIPTTSKYEFIAKKGNYWNTPKHYVIIDNKVYNIKRSLQKGYFCDLDETITVEEITKTKNSL